MKRHVAPVGDVVRLRMIEERDLESTLAWRNRDDARIWFKTSTILTMEQHRAWFRHYLTKDDDFLFVVEADGKLVGQAAVYGIDWVAGHAEVGRFLAAPESRGKGYIRQACSVLLRVCADEFRLTSVFLEVFETNERAIRIYEENGFSESSRHDGMVRMERALSHR